MGGALTRRSLRAPIGFAGNTVIVAIHNVAIARLSAVDRRRTCFARVVAAVPIISRLWRPGPLIPGDAEPANCIGKYLPTVGRRPNSSNCTHQSGCPEIFGDVSSRLHGLRIPLKSKDFVVSAIAEQLISAVGRASDSITQCAADVHAVQMAADPQEVLAPRAYAGEYHQLIVGPGRPRPSCQLTPSTRRMPEAVLPMLRSNTSRHGTSVKSRDRSTRA